MNVPAYARPLVLLVTAAAALTLTFSAWHSARDQEERGASLRFDARAVEISRAIRDRMLDYEQALRGAAGLFVASERVDRAEWTAYIRSARIEEAYPGILAVGYAPWVAAGGRAALERTARADGAPGYAIFPPGERAAMTPVYYVSPLDDRNRRSLGYDMYYEPVRRRAMDDARRKGEPAVSGVVTLIQDAGGAAQPGFLLYLPVFHAAREGRLQGFVYASFRARELVAGVAGRNPGVQITLSDVTDPAAPAELYAQDRLEALRSGAARFERVEEFSVRERRWRLDAASLPAFEADVASARPRLVLAGGLAISVLILLIVWSLLATRDQARDLARAMTASLRASEERLQLALTSSNLALFDWNVETGLVHLSSAWSAMLGGPAVESDVPSQKLLLLVHPEDVAAVEQQVRALLAGDIDAYRMQHRVRREDGSWLWIESAARANRRDAAGRALRVTGANTDITERKTVEALKNEFIATVSHELRTPLTSALASLALVREGAAGELPAQARAFVETAYANSERLADLVNDILDMEKIESGGMEIRLQPVALAPLFARVVELNTPYAEKYGVRLAAEAGAGLAASADPERLVQVLTNLVSNAVKFSPPGETVRLRALAIDAGARLEVSDRGPGIPPEFRERVFGKFAQADKDEARRKGGTGLGLAITKALVERMNGRIGFDTGSGGTTFWIEMPRA